MNDLKDIDVYVRKMKKSFLNNMFFDKIFEPFENIPEGNLLEMVFNDGKRIKDYTLDEIERR